MSGNAPRDAKKLPDFSIPVSKLNNVGGGRLASLLRVPIDYVLEVYDFGGDLTTCVTLPNTPEQIECTRPLAASIRHTLGSLPIRQIVESRSRTIVLKGRSGVTPRQGYTRSGDLKFQDPREALLEFDGFLQDYSLMQENYQRLMFTSSLSNKIKQPKLVFRAFNEKINLLVEPTSWFWFRSADTSRLSYQWELTLTAYGYSNEIGIPENVFSPIDAYARSVGDAINSVATSLGTLANASTNLRNDMKALVSPALNALRNLGISAQNLAGSVNRLMLLPKEVLANFVVAASAFKDAVDRFREIANPFDEDTYRSEIDTFRTVFGETADAAERVANQGLFCTGGGPSSVASAELALQGTDTLSTQSTNVESKESLFSVYQTRVGDTLINIAQRVLGDANRWVDIARINNFTDAHTHENGVLVPGTRLLLPIRSDIDTAQAVIGAKSTEELLGIDLALNLATGDLVLHAGDIAVRHGASNIEQALAVRLLTRKGTLPMFPEYGLPIAPGVGMTSRVAAYAGLHCKEQVLRDSRVSEVRNVQVQDEGDGVSIGMIIVPIDGGNMEFVAPLDTRA